MEKARKVTADVEILPAHFPIPGMGFLAVNAFVIHAGDPVLVDTGMKMHSEEFMKVLESVIDPQDLRWVWLTHDDADHTGNLEKVLQAAPKARLAANSLAVLRMSTAWSVPMDRVYWLNPGDSISLGDRKLLAVRPPLFDNPTTIGAYDDKSGVFFPGDCFGAVIPSPVKDADDIPEGELAQAMIGWASLDSPWVHMVEPGNFRQGLDAIRQMAPPVILSGHLPPARGKTEQFLRLLDTLPTSEPLVTPDQAALERILAQVKGS